MKFGYITAALLAALLITACGQGEVQADKTEPEEIQTVEINLEPEGTVSEAAAVTEAVATETTVSEATAEVSVYEDRTRFGSLAPASDRVTVQNGFYYESLQPEVMDYIKGVSYPAEDTDVITPGDFRYVHVLHIGADGNVHGGELIVNKKIAEDITDIFIKLYEAGYRIEKIKLIDEYNGDDDLSVQDNNTSSFNFRFVAGSKHLSKHSLGMAIDINPLYNPYIVNGKVADWGAPYTDRTKDFPYKMTKDDLCVKLFKQHGFKWGGDCWKNTLDYQHFEKN